jgi:MOSC domain-containing protein YiiM
MTDAGRLAGIARRERSRSAMEVVTTAAVTLDQGVAGDYRGRIAPGGKGRRQVTLLEAESWEAALAELGEALPWQTRRANLLVSGLRLPREAGCVIAIGTSLKIEITGECDPCQRMDELAHGLKAALTPDWRGGVTGRVIADGTIAVGDEIRIEP